MHVWFQLSQERHLTCHHQPDSVIIQMCRQIQGLLISSWPDTEVFMHIAGCTVHMIFATVFDCLVWHSHRLPINHPYSESCHVLTVSEIFFSSQNIITRASLIFSIQLEFLVFADVKNVINSQQSYVLLKISLCPLKG